MKGGPKSRAAILNRPSALNAHYFHGSFPIFLFFASFLCCEISLLFCLVVWLIIASSFKNVQLRVVFVVGSPAEQSV